MRILKFVEPRDSVKMYPCIELKTNDVEETENIIKELFSKQFCHSMNEMEKDSIIVGVDKSDLNGLGGECNGEADYGLGEEEVESSWCKFQIRLAQNIDDLPDCL